jgi:hypothetical protein
VVETSSTHGLIVDVAMVFSPSHEKLSRLDRRSSHRLYTTIWSTSSSKFSVSYFPISQLPTTQLHHHSTSPSSRLAHCSSLHCTPRAAPPLPPTRLAHCSSRNLCEPLHALRHAVARSKGKGMLLHFTDGSLSDYFPL